MLSSTEKMVILSGTLFGSIFIFTTSLNSINDILLGRNGLYNPKDNNYKNKLIVMNGITMAFSGFTFGYFAYNATK